MAIIYIKTNDGTREFEVSPDDPSKNAIGIGRSTDNQLQLSSSTVSNRHARIDYEDDQVIIYDLNSAAGTFVNKKPIGRHILNVDDSILVGNQELNFVGLEVEPTEASQNQIDEDPKTAEFAEIDTDDEPENSSEIEHSDLNISDYAETYDGPEQFDEVIDIVEPWAHLEAQDETEDEKKVFDGYRDSDLPQPASDFIIGSINSKPHPTSDGDNIQKNDQPQPSSATVEFVNSIENVATPDGDTAEESEGHEIQSPTDLNLENSPTQATNVAIDKPSIKKDSPERKEPSAIQQPLDLPESDTSVHTPHEKESDQSTPAQKDTAENIRESAGQKTIQLERPSYLDDLSKLDIELPAPVSQPVSQLESTSKNDPEQDPDTIFASTMPDLFQYTDKQPVISEPEQSTKQHTPEPQTKKQQTTLEIVAPAVAPATVQKTASVSADSRETRSASVKAQAPSDSHLVIQAGPNIGNRAALNHHRTVLGINGHQYVAVTRGKESFMASGLDSDVVVSINGIPLDTKPLALEDGDSLEFFDVRLRFVA